MRELLVASFEKKLAEETSRSSSNLVTKTYSDGSKYKGQFNGEVKEGKGLC